MNVARFAALDMHGPRGATARRHVVLADFVLAAVVGIGSGALVVLTGLKSTGMLLFGILLLGLGANYAALSAHAIRLRRLGGLERELRGVDVPAELRRHSARQLLLAMPFAVAGAAVLQALRQSQA